MNFSEAVNEVLRLTGRPDKAASAKRNVNEAISFVVIEGAFVYDVVEDIIPINPELYVQTMGYDAFTRFRKVAYMRPADSSVFIQPVAPKDIFLCGKQLTNVYYLAADGIKIHTEALHSQMLVGYYEYPKPLDGTLIELPEQDPVIESHWTLERIPYVIINKAASGLFQEVGNTDESTRLYQQFVAGFESAKRDFKHGITYG